MSTELALTRPEPTMDEDSLRVMMSAAKRYVESGLLPAEVNTAAKALVVMTAGREMGVPATYALRNIHVVKGKPVCSAELLLALVRRTYGPSAIRVAKTSNAACTVQYREHGWDGISEYTFTIEDAQRAGVANGNQWKSYPAAMLRARTISAVARFAFPEAIAGLYTPEEMGAHVTVDDAGEVHIVDGEFTEAPAPVEREVCDADHWNKTWHATVAGTRFADNDTRHKFLAFYTQNKFDSLTAFLEQATEDDASALITSIKRRIDAEAKKAAEAQSTQSPEELSDAELDERLATSRPSTTTRDPNAKTRTLLVVELRQAIKEANDAGGQFSVPTNLENLTDDDIKDTITGIRQAVAAANTLVGSPA